jgi:hypothetical protein
MGRTLSPRSGCDGAADSPEERRRRGEWVTEFELRAIDRANPGNAGDMREVERRTIEVLGGALDGAAVLVEYRLVRQWNEHDA